jgi:hypothetical protein
VYGDRAYQVLNGTTRPAEGFPCRVTLATPWCSILQGDDFMEPSSRDAGFVICWSNKRCKCTCRHVSWRQTRALVMIKILEMNRFVSPQQTCICVG